MSQQIFGAAAAVIALNRAFNDQSPSNAVFQNQLSVAEGDAANGYANFAKQFAASFSGLSNAELANKVMGNMGLLPNDALEAALVDYLAGPGATNRGLVVLQLANILSGLETASGSLAVYNDAAVAWNTEVTKAYTYSADPASTEPSSNDATVGKTFVLTTGIDSGASFTGGALNDIFDATKGASGAATLGALDSIDGGAGDNTLNVAQLANILLTSSTSVKNIQTANLVSSGTVSVDASGWTGLTTASVSSVGGETIKLGSDTALTAVDSALAAGTIAINGGSSINVSATGSTTGSITVGATTAPTGAVTVSNTSTGAVSMGAINVNGGTTVNVTQATGNAVNTTTTLGTVTVTGTDATSAVTVSNAKAVTASATKAGVNANSVAITDVNAGSTTKAGTITSATVSGFTTLGIAGNALTSLSVANGSGNIIIDNSGLTTPTNKTLDLTIDGQTGGTLDDADIYTTLNVTTAGANSTLANVTFGGLTALAVDGDKKLTLTSTAGLTALKTVTVSGSAGIAATLSGATVTSVDASATSGANTVTIDASKATFTGGTGADAVTVTAAAVTKAIALGAGNDTLDLTAATAAPTAAVTGGDGTDTVVVTAAQAAAASANAAFAGKVSGFEQLALSGATNQTIDLAVLGNYNHVTTAGGNGLTLSNLSSGGTLVLAGAGTAYTIGNTAFTAGTDDTVNLTLTDGSGAGVSFASTGITASGVENFAITTADTQATPSGTFLDAVTLLGNSVKTVTVAGNAGLNLTAASTALTSVDASGVTLGGFTFTSGALAAAATVKGSAAGANTVNVSAATAAVTYTGGTGADAVTANNVKNNVVDLGDGANSFTGGNGNNTVTAGKGADTVTVGNGNNTVSLGDGANAFTAGSGNNTYTGGANVDTVTVGGGKNVIVTGAGADVVTFTAASANVNSYSTVSDAIKGDTIVLMDKGTEVFGSAKVALADTAVFQDYANAVVQAGGNASVNGYIGWFQFAGDTYVVESAHDGSGVNASFVNGTDVIVKLSGLVDLSAATVTGNSILLG